MFIDRYGFPHVSMVKNSFNAGDLGLITGIRRSPEKGRATHSSIFVWQIPWIEEPGGATVHGVTKSQIRLSN